MSRDKLKNWFDESRRFAESVADQVGGSVQINQDPSGGDGQSFQIAVLKSNQRHIVISFNVVLASDEKAIAVQLGFSSTLKERDEQIGGRPVIVSNLDDAQREWEKFFQKVKRAVNSSLGKKASVGSSLRQRVIKLAYERKDLRPHLLPLVCESRNKYAFMKHADAGDVDNFVEEMGDRKVENPNPDSKDKHPKVKVKSLPNSEKGKGLFKRLFDRWKKKFKGDGQKKRLKKLKKKLRRPSDKQLKSFYREMKKEKGSLPKEKELEDYYDDNIDKVVDHYVKNPPSKPKDEPTSKDVAFHYQRTKK